MQLRLVVTLIGGGIEHAVGFDKHDSLATGVFYPQDEVRVKTRVLEEANALAPAQVSQQVDFLVCQKIVLVQRQYSRKSLTNCSSLAFNPGGVLMILSPRSISSGW